MVYKSPGTSFTRKDALDGNKPEEAASALLSRLREWPVVDERVLNGGVRLKKHRRFDPDEQVAAALTGFESKGFFMLAEGRQMESLDEELFVPGDAQTTWVKLVPLVGR